MANEITNITALEQLREYKAGQIVELPPFAEGQPFVAKLKRPSLLRLIANGKVPNQLLITAQEMFMKSASGMNPNKQNMAKEMLPILDIMAEEALEEPTYKQIKEVGLDLTDEQLMFLFTYTQAGVRSLENFRSQQESGKFVSDVQTLQQKTK